MSGPRDDLRPRIRAMLEALPPAEWVREMIDHYNRTGTYRPEDLRRLLGDPNRAIQVGPDVGPDSSLPRAKVE